MIKVWIDKKGGRHYHKESCTMKTDPLFHYESVLKRLRLEMSLHTENGDLIYFRPIRVDGKVYRMCPGCFGKSRSNRKEIK